MLHLCVKNGLDPLEIAIKAAHACGVKLFPQNRLMGTQLAPMHRLWRQVDGRHHPEWMCIYADDEPTRHFSFAFEGVPNFHVRLMRE